MVNVTNGTNQSSIYGSTVNGCFYAAKDGVEEGLDGRKRFMLIVNVCSFFMLIHLIITHLYTYKKNKRYKRKYEDLSMFQKIFVCFVKVDDLPDRKFGFPVNMVTHAVLLNFPTTLSMILVLLIAPFRKTICELPVLCAISGVSVYWTSLSTCSIALSLAFIINRVVLDKKLQLDRNALKTCQKKYQNPALLVAYVVNFILAFLCIAPFKFGPMYLYCGTHKSLKGRLFYYVPFLLYGVITLIFTVPVVVHFGGQILKERKKGAEDKPTSAAAKRRKKSQDQIKCYDENHGYCLVARYRNLGCWFPTVRLYHSIR